MLLWIGSEAVATSVDNEIEHLLDYVRQSDVVFIRNGTEHKASVAAEHMQKKRQRFKDQIRTAEDFIRLAATRSLLSNQPYLVRTGDGNTQECSTWLQNELNRFRKSKK
jgi:hypothetical protein